MVRSITEPEVFVRTNVACTTALLDAFLKYSIKRYYQVPTDEVYGDLTLYRPGHDLRYAMDPTKIETELGWKPEYTFDTGIPVTIQWYLDNKEWWEHIVNGEYTKYFDNMYRKRLEQA